MGRRTKLAAILVIVATVLGLGWWARQPRAPQREALAAVRRLATALNGSASAEQTLQLLSLPPALRGRTSAEQVEFIRKALRDEISEGGVSALQRYGQFGPLKQLFPQQADAWATQAGVQVDDCVAFKLERNGQLAEVVLVRDSGLDGPPVLRVVRVNNVKQMAVGKL